MVVSPIRPALTPGLTGSILAAVLGGVALGTFSGLTPGLHANNFALMLASVATTVPGPPRLVTAAMLAAGVVHTFLDVVPALALGVPDAAMAATALPGHRLVLAGRGREALRLSALGSGAAVVFAVPLAVPLTRLMVTAYPVVRAHLSLLLAAVVGFLLLTEPTRQAALGGAIAFAVATVLGALTLDLSPAAPLTAGGMLAPLFAGLFGAPVLIDAMDGAGVPVQSDLRVTLPRKTLWVTAAAGSLAGAVVGYLPGISAAIASVLALPAVPGDDDVRGFLVATSGANTANTVFALFALVALGTPRTGVMVAVDSVGGPPSLSVHLAVIAVAAAAGFVLVLAVGDRYLLVVGRTDYRVLSLGVLGLLVVISFLFAGLVGVVVFGVATAIGLLPPRLRTRRVYLMGVLVGPLALGL